MNFALVKTDLTQLAPAAIIQYILQVDNLSSRHFSQSWGSSTSSSGWRVPGESSLVGGQIISSGPHIAPSSLPPFHRLHLQRSSPWDWVFHAWFEWHTYLPILISTSLYAVGALSFKIGDAMWNAFPSLGEQSHTFLLGPGEKHDPDVTILDFTAQLAAFSPF